MHSINVASTGENFGRRKELAIAALLANGTLKKAAAKAGISERTLRRWMRDPVFLARYRDERKQALGQITNTLRRQSLMAVKILGRIAANSKTPASARVTAARSIIEMSFRGTELYELDERISEIEIAVASWIGEGTYARAS